MWKVLQSSWIFAFPWNAAPSWFYESNGGGRCSGIPDWKRFRVFAAAGQTVRRWWVASHPSRGNQPIGSNSLAAWLIFLSLRRRPPLSCILESLSLSLSVPSPSSDSASILVFTIFLLLSRMDSIPHLHTFHVVNLHS